MAGLRHRRSRRRMAVCACRQIVAARPEGARLEGVKLFDWSPRALYAVPIIVFGFNSHPNVVSVFAELEQFPRILARLPDRCTAASWRLRGSCSPAGCMTAAFP